MGRFNQQVRSLGVRGGGETPRFSTWMANSSGVYCIVFSLVSIFTDSWSDFVDLGPPEWGCCSGVPRAGPFVTVYE